MTRRRTVLATLVASLAMALGTAPAGALPILEPADAEELAADLAEATAVQGICYGWLVELRDDGTGLTSAEYGSSRGVGTRVQDPSCPRWMVFHANITYTAPSSESEDSASFSVLSNITGAPTEPDLRRIGIGGDALVGPDDDLAVINATLALPALAAEAGLARPLALEPNPGAIPPADKPTGRPGSDWTRSYGHFLLLSGVLVLGGATWAGWAWAAERHGWNDDDGDEQ